jgi:hypothetical protein
VRLNVTLSCDLANVPPAAVDALKASADRLLNAALEQVKGVAAAYANGAVSSQPVAAPAACSGRHSLAARAARAVSDATAGIASVLIIAEAERAEAERLVGAHCVGQRQRPAGTGRGGGAGGAAGDRGERRGGGRVLCGVWAGQGEAVTFAIYPPRARSGASLSYLGPPAMAHRCVERARPYR